MAYIYEPTSSSHSCLQRFLAVQKLRNCFKLVSSLTERLQYLIYSIPECINFLCLLHSCVSPSDPVLRVKADYLEFEQSYSQHNILRPNVHRTLCSPSRRALGGRGRTNLPPKNISSFPFREERSQTSMQKVGEGTAW